MAGLIPIGSGGSGEASRPTCFRCGEPAFGPCGLCRVTICSSDECSELVREPGLPEVVLCADCARLRPALASRLWVPPLVAFAGAAGLAVLVLTRASSTLAGVGYIAAVLALMVSAAMAISRRLWRSRLARARRR